MRKKKVIVTGVSSFVGMHLARAFAANDWQVIAITSRAMECYEGIRLQRLKVIADNVEFQVCDLTDVTALEAVISFNQPDLWVQHAGYAENYGSLNYNLQKSFTMNVLALEPLYRNLSQQNCGVIITGSSMEYSSSDQANQEDDVCWPDFPYGVSKLAETIEAKRLAYQYNVPTRVARLYIPVGEYDAPGKLIETVIGALTKNESVDLSPCTQKRDFLGVNDIADAYLKLAEDMGRQKFDVFNICSGKSLQLRKLLEELAVIIDASPDLLQFGAHEMRPGEAMVSYGSNYKAKKILGWVPREMTQTMGKLVSFHQHKLFDS